MRLVQPAHSRLARLRSGHEAGVRLRALPNGVITAIFVISGWRQIHAHVQMIKISQRKFKAFSDVYAEGDLPFHLTRAKKQKYTALHAHVEI